MYQAAEDRGALPRPFFPGFAALRAFGPVAALLVPVLGAFIKRRAANGAAVIAATAAASYAHHALGGTTGAFVWPFQGAPIAAAVVVYAFVKVLAMQVVTPLVTRKPVNRAWPRVLLRECPTYIVGAGVAVGVVELMVHRNWQVLPLALVPLFFAFRAYADYMRRLENEERRLEVIDAFDHGMAVVDRNGRLTEWSPGPALLRACPRDPAMGRPPASAVAPLLETTLPRDLAATLA